MTGSPHDQNAEMSVIGAMFLDAEAIDDALARLVPDDFYLTAHREIFAAIRALTRSRARLDIVTIHDELTRRGTLMNVGGVPYLTDLSRYTPSAANIGSYIAIVRDKSVLRNVRDTARAMLKAAEEGMDDPQGIIARADRALAGASDRYAAQSKGGDMASILKDAYRVISERAAGKGTGLPTGIADLDRITGGLFPGELTAIGARPGTGKSAVALCVAKNAAQRGAPAILFSREMSKGQLGERMYANLTGINSRKLRSGRVSEGEYVKLAQAMEEGARLPITVDTDSRTPSEIRAMCRKHKRSPQGLGLVIVDYLQLLKPDRFAEAQTREQTVSALSAAMKDLSAELEVPVIEVAQLNRMSANGRSKPSMSEFRESGAIEQDANNVWLLYEPKYGDDGYSAEKAAALEKKGKRLVHVIVAKARSGELGTIETAFDPALSRFQSVTWQDGPSAFRRPEA